MWEVTTFVSTPVELDFSSSGLGYHSSTAIDAGGIRLFNALDLVDFELGLAQVYVCSDCGTPHCERGNWVALRRVGADVMWLPAFAQMESGEWEAQEYTPPRFVADRGAPLFRASTWEALRAIRSDVPRADDLPALASREAVQLLQWSAPGRVLGRHPQKPSLERKRVVAVTEGDRDAIVKDVDAALAHYYEAAVRLAIQPRSTLQSRIELWLDLPGTPAWSAFGYGSEGIVLLFGEGDALAPT
jgi:hypothetical protein